MAQPFRCVAFHSKNETEGGWIQGPSATETILADQCCTFAWHNYFKQIGLLWRLSQLNFQSAIAGCSVQAPLGRVFVGGWHTANHPRSKPPILRERKNRLPLLS